MTGYTRQSTYSDGDTILAADSNNEFDAIEITMAAGTGHAHDNNAGQGAFVPLISNVANSRKVEVTASGALTTGDHQVTGQIISDSGPITATLGNIVATAGNVVATAGSVDATVGAVTAGTTVTGATGVIATTGGVTATAGGVTASAGNIVATLGNIDATAGSLNAGTTVTAGTGVTVTTGNLAVSSGNITVSGTVDGRDVSVDGTKLDTIETNAKDDQTAAEVVSTPAGNLAATDVQAALNELDIEKAALAGAAFTGAITTTSTFDGRDVSVDGTKLDGIETAATADQVASEVTSTAAGNIASTDVQAALQEIDAFTPRKNLIIGGDFHTNPWQRGTSFTPVVDATYTADRFLYDKSGTMVHNISKATDSPTVAQAGIFTENCLLLDCTTVDTSLAAGDLTLIGQRMEGYDWSRIAQRAFTVSFWHKHTKTGTYCVGFTNDGNDRSFVAEYTQSVTDTWEKATVAVLASPAAGTWDYTSGIGIQVRFAVAAGTTFQTTAGAWQTGNFFATANQVNACDSTANNFRLALIQIEEGTVATDFELRSFYEELSAAQRYFETLADVGMRSENAAAGAAAATHSYRVTKRAVPTLSNISAGPVGTLQNTVDFVGVTGTSDVFLFFQSTATADAEL